MTVKPREMEMMSTWGHQALGTAMLAMTMCARGQTSMVVVMMTKTALQNTMRRVRLHQVRHNILLKAVGEVVGVDFSGTSRRVVCLSEDKDVLHCDLELVMAGMSDTLHAV